VFAIISVVNDKFLTYNNIYGLLIQLPSYGIAALGLTFCLICGELNITMGSIMAFSGVLFAMLVGTTGFIIAIAITLLCCALFGAFTGVVVSFWKIDSFVATLSMMILIKGVALTICNSKPVIVMDQTTIMLSNLTVGPIPAITIIFLVIVFVLEYVLRFTVFGRNIYAVGGNADIASSIGINVKFYKFIVFVIFAVLAGIGGLFLMTRMNAGSPIIGDDAPLATIPMAIMGGTALSGGRGGALKTLTGVVLLSLLFNSMSILGITLDIQTFIKGAILLSIIVWNKYLANKAKKV